MDHLHLNKNLALEGTADLSAADYAVFGVPFDGTQTNRTGARDGPFEARRALLELEKDGFYERRWVDLGNVEAVPGNARETLARTREVVSAVLEKNPRVRLLALGGEHTISHPIVEALSLRGKLKVLSFDAHADLRDDYMGEKWGHSTVMRRISELGVEVAVAGVRSMSAEERDYSKAKKIRVLGPARLDEEEIVEWAGGGRLYVTVDLDVFDPVFAAGVGNPEPGGVGFEKVSGLVRELVARADVVGLDVVELTPAYDNGGAAAAAAKLALDYIQQKH